MITFEQVKTLTEGQVVYTIKENKIKEARITSITEYKASEKPPYFKDSFRICYKLKGGTYEYTEWAMRNYSALALYLTKEAVAEALISDVSIRMEELEKQLASCKQKIEEAKSFGGMKSEN